MAGKARKCRTKRTGGPGSLLLGCLGWGVLGLGVGKQFNFDISRRRWILTLPILASLKLQLRQSYRETQTSLFKQQLDERLRTIEREFTAHAIGISGPLYSGVDDLIRTAIEKRHSESPTRRKLVVILTTTGPFA